jgi:DNA-binding Lrp family transcriptional regulator
MPQKGKRRVDHKILMALACGASAENAARQVGVSESTVFRRLDEPDFRRRLQKLRADMVQRTAGALTAAGAEAVRGLLELLRGAKAEAVRLGAMRSVLEIGMKVREFAELEERLATLEQQAETHKSY